MVPMEACKMAALARLLLSVGGCRLSHPSQRSELCRRGTPFPDSKGLCGLNRYEEHRVMRKGIYREILHHDSCTVE